ncbi:MAG TPA: FAD:protein FMN transferase [Solirubrobacteraceae bacterium]|nr:FAD:protein FMN transferase [Solirubrobacteraceae bacterium]
MTAGVAGGAPISHAEPVMGTVVSFVVHPGDLGAAAAAAAVARACQILHEADAIFSTYRPDSPVSRLRRGEAALAELPSDVAAVLELCEHAKEVSAGWFDPWAMPGGVDPTGLVKGWAAERALAELVGAGVLAAMVNAAGDLVVHGQPPGQSAWRIGIRHPWRGDALACIIEADAAVATSGSYERGAHLIDPKIGQPRTRAASATVTGPSLALADALATALAVAGPRGIELVVALAGYDAYVIDMDGGEHTSAGIRVASALPVPDEA